MKSFPINYYYNRRICNYYLFIGIFFLIAIFISFFLFKNSNNYILLLCFMLMMILYILEKRHIVLSIYEDYFILKPYSIGASCVINNDEIIEVKTSKNYLIITVKNFKNPCRINLNVFDIEFRQEIIKYLESLSVKMDKLL